MPEQYYLKVLALGQQPEIEINKEYFCGLKSAKQTLVKALACEEKYEIAIYNYLDLEKECAGIAIQEMIRPSFRQNDFFALRLSVNIKIANLLSSARLYTDSLHKDIHACLQDDVGGEKIRKIVDEEYQNNFHYRFMHELRNYTQHNSLPARGITTGRKLTKNKQIECYSDFFVNKTSNYSPLSRLAWVCRHSGSRRRRSDRWGQSKIAVIEVDGRMGGDFTLTPAFSGNCRVRGRVVTKTNLFEDGFREEILGQMEEAVNLILAIRHYVEAVSKIHIQARGLIETKVTAARRCIESAVNQYKAAGAENNSVTGLYAVNRNEQNIVIEKFALPVLLDMDDIRLHLKEKNGSQLTDLHRQYATTQTDREN